MSRKDRAIAALAEEVAVAGLLLTTLVMEYGAGLDGERVVALTDEQCLPNCGVFISKTPDGWTLTAHRHDEEGS